MFNKEDRVYDVRFGYGTVNSIENKMIHVDFDKFGRKSYTLDGCYFEGEYRSLFFRNTFETLNNPKL